MKTVVVLGRSFLSTRTASSTASFVPNRKSYWDRMYEHAKQQQETSSRNNNSGGSAKGDKTNAAKKGAVEEEEENDGSSYNESALRRMASIMFPAPMANTNMNSLTSSSSAIPATRFDKKSLAANVALRRSSNLGQEQQQSLMPTNATMLTRDFIHDSLYNPAYGYFTQRVEILGPPEPIQFSKIPDVYNLMNHLGNLYAEADANTSASTTSEERNTDFRADSGKKSSSSSSSTATSTSATSPDQIIEARQMWHTPTELFQPYYGYAIANYIISQYKSNPRGADHLSLYEIGSGNGTLMMNILDYLKQHESLLYESVQYTVIEISPSLANKLSARIKIPNREGNVHEHCIRIVNADILEWDQVVPEPCFFIAMEVIDNFPHDMVRYCTSTKQPLQGIVYVDETGDFHEEFEHVSDPLIQKYLELRQAVGYISPLLKPSPLFSRLYTKLSPFSSNMTAPEFLPTMCMSLFDRLHSHFPHHQLVLSDFSALPESILGIDAPVVQTRYKGESIASSTLLVHPGWFDIFFPTNFEVMARIYEEIGRRRRKMRELSGEGEPTETTSSTSSVLTQQRFLKNYSPCLDATKTYLGENAILSFYDNMKFLLTK